MPNFLTAAEVNSLKAKVKTEMQRRAYNGSMTGFAAASYDFSTTPTSGTKVTADQGKKVIEPLLNIKDHGNLNTADLKTGSKIPSSFNNELLSYTDSLSKEPIDGATSSCRGACSGLCVGTCGNTCSGCSSCSGGCTGSGGSGGSGSSGCGGCSGNCGGCNSCSGCSGCSSGCQGGCTGTCDGCSRSCGGCIGCSGSCESCSGCAGCGGSCSSSCSSSGKGSSCATCYGCTGCASSCSSCSSCTGCSGSSGCLGCSSGCSSCANTCDGGCSGCGGCEGTCESSCTTGCQGCSGCSGGCSGCSGGCGSGCYGSCTGNCDGCSNGCSGQCKNACATTCSATCTGTCQAQAFGAVVSGGIIEDPTVDLIANGMMMPIYSKTLWKQVLPGGGYANNSNYELKDLGIQIRYDKKNSEILFDLSNGLTVVDNTIFKQLGYKLPIPLFVMLNDSNITYNPNHVGSSDNYWPPTIENANDLVINAGQGYQIMVSPNEITSANKKCTRFDLIWYKYNTTKNYPEVGSIFKGSKVIRIPFKITGI